jgi:hypothetical protein
MVLLCARSRLDLTVSIRTAILADSPTLYLPLDDPTGPAASDASGNHHAGIYYGSFMLGQQGPESGTTCAYFADQSGNALLPNQPFGNVFPWSIEVWLAINSFPSAAQAFAYWADFSNNKGMGYTLTSGGLVNNKLGVNRYGVGQLTSTTIVPNNDWHQYVFTQGRSGVTQFDCYLDGVSIANFVTGYNANIAGAGYMGCGGLQSYCAHFAFYSAALSAVQVANHFSARTGALPAPSTTGTNNTPDQAILNQILASVRKVF